VENSEILFLHKSLSRFAQYTPEASEQFCVSIENALFSKSGPKYFRYIRSAQHFRTKRKRLTGEIRTRCTVNNQNVNYFGGSASVGDTAGARFDSTRDTVTRRPCRVIII